MRREKERGVTGLEDLSSIQNGNTRKMNRKQVKKSCKEKTNKRTDIHISEMQILFNLKTFQDFWSPNLFLYRYVM